MSDGTATPPRSGRGRPCAVTAEVQAFILEHLPFHDFGLEGICRDNPKLMPSPSAVYRFLADPKNLEFREKYARAREIQGDVQAERALNDGLTATDAQIGRLRMDARKWAAGHLKPAKYGKKLEVGVSPENPLFSMIERIASATIPVASADSPDDGGGE